MYALLKSYLLYIIIAIGNVAYKIDLFHQRALLSPGYESEALLLQQRTMASAAQW